MRYDSFKKMHDLSMMYGSQEDVTNLVKSTERVSSPCDAQDYDLPIVASEQDTCISLFGTDDRWQGAIRMDGE